MGAFVTLSIYLTPVHFAAFRAAPPSCETEMGVIVNFKTESPGLASPAGPLARGRTRDRRKALTRRHERPVSHVSLSFI